jgi:hypothetical protein
MNKQRSDFCKYSPRVSGDLCPTRRTRTPKSPLIFLFRIYAARPAMSRAFCDGMCTLCRPARVSEALLFQWEKGRSGIWWAAGSVLGGVWTLFVESRLEVFRRASSLCLCLCLCLCSCSCSSSSLPRLDLTWLEAMIIIEPVYYIVSTHILPRIVLSPG